LKLFPTYGPGKSSSTSHTCPMALGFSGGTAGMSRP
jgi:hypothetical protein